MVTGFLGCLGSAVETRALWLTFGRHVVPYIVMSVRRVLGPLSIVVATAPATDVLGVLNTTDCNALLILVGVIVVGLVVVIWVNCRRICLILVVSIVIVLAVCRLTNVVTGLPLYMTRLLLPNLVAIFAPAGCSTGLCWLLVIALLLLSRMGVLMVRLYGLGLRHRSMPLTLNWVATLVSWIVARLFLDVIYVIALLDGGLPACATIGLLGALVIIYDGSVLWVLARIALATMLEGRARRPIGLASPDE